MKKEEKLVKKVKRLLKRMGMPRWLHHFGPKTYEFLDHLKALLIRSYCRLSYRRIKKLMECLGIKCPSKSALQATASKLDAFFWQRILQMTSGMTYLCALDATGFSRENPSYYYLRRIDGKMPKIHVKLNAAFDTKKKKFLAAKVRILPCHDIRDARYLLEKSNPQIAVADKGYNAESLYEFADEKKILLMIPKKKNTRRGHYRKKMNKYFRIRTYHRRELVESGFSSIKRKFGSSVSSKKARTIRSEIYGKLVCHNIFSLSFVRFRTEPILPGSPKGFLLKSKACKGFG